MASNTFNEIPSIHLKPPKLPSLLAMGKRASLARLQMSKLGIGQLHWSTANYAPPQEISSLEWFSANVREGLVRAVGVSNYGPNPAL
ncbi:hypothetical protein CUMW_221750 [Citrus unshiu]|uniref:NADP-dependent oxidoreductase domain-containing protein n=1 Tax=Citrus unshiu TaxID=55188 RepID=A0A2H5QED8_CITUN|nr:hypothetical protein CUMW_221750 [Citrus unshiu]